MPNRQTADSNGLSNIDVVGAPQQEDLTRRKVFEVYKAAGVTVGVQIKPMKIKDAQAGGCVSDRAYPLPTANLL